MPEITDLGFCPRCGVEFYEVPIGFIKHVKFCKVCSDFLRTAPQAVGYYIRHADSFKEFIKECHPINTGSIPDKT